MSHRQVAAFLDAALEDSISPGEEQLVVLDDRHREPGRVPVGGRPLHEAVEGVGVELGRGGGSREPGGERESPDRPQRSREADPHVQWVSVSSRSRVRRG